MQISPNHRLTTPVALLCSLALIVITVLTFSPALRGEFLNWDDDRHLTENLQTQLFSWENTRNIFTSTVNKTYIPLTILSFNLEHRLFGLNPLVYHLNNLLLHTAVVVAVFFLTMMVGLSCRGAFLAALRFGIHPMHTESVAWITERKDVLYSLFYVLSLYSYCRYQIKGKKRDYCTGLAFAFFSILAKPMALSLPWILLTFDVLLKRRLNLRILLDKIPFLIIVEPIAWISYSLNSRTPNVHFPDFLLTWIWTSTFYLKKFFFPFPLSPVYRLPQPVHLSNPEYGLAVIISLLSVGGMAYAAVRVLKQREQSRGKYFWLAACLFYAGSTFFLWRFDENDAGLVADRFMYLPSLGFCWLFGFYGERFLRHFEKRTRDVFAFAAVLSLFMGTLAFKTSGQCGVWESPLTLWNSVIAAYPDYHIAYNNRGNLFSPTEFELAIKDFDQAIRLAPDYAEAYYNKGLTLARMGRYEEALQHYALTIKFNPHFVQAYNNRGFIFSEIQARPDLAVQEYTRAITVKKNFPAAYHNRGLVFARQGEYQKALADFTQAITLNPHYASAYLNRSQILFSLGQYAPAMNDLKTAKGLGMEVDEGLLREMERRGRF